MDSILSALNPLIIRQMKEDLYSTQAKISSKLPETELRSNLTSSKGLEYTTFFKTSEKRKNFLKQEFLKTQTNKKQSDKFNYITVKTLGSSEEYQSEKGGSTTKKDHVQDTYPTKHLHQNTQRTQNLLHTRIWQNNKHPKSIQTLSFSGIQRNGKPKPQLDFPIF